jgi:hypothetical protein
MFAGTKFYRSNIASVRIDLGTMSRSDREPTASARPGSPQNFAAGALSAPDFGEHFKSPTPHSEQNFLLSGFSDWQFAQCITLPCAQTLDDSFHYHRCAGRKSAPDSYLLAARGGRKSLMRNALASILANLSSALKVLAGLLACLPADFSRSQPMEIALGNLIRLAGDICWNRVPHDYTPRLVFWMDRIQATSRRIR